MFPLCLYAAKKKITSPCVFYPFERTMIGINTREKTWPTSHALLKGWLLFGALKWKEGSIVAEMR